MKKFLSLLAGICLLAGCSSAGEQISLAGKKFVMQNSEAGTTVTLEFADSVGVSVITSSLGYFTFDVDSLSYTQADLDGRTAFISQAAHQAATATIEFNLNYDFGYQPSQPWP